MRCRGRVCHARLAGRWTAVTITEKIGWERNSAYLPRCRRHYIDGRRLLRRDVKCASVLHVQAAGAWKEGHGWPEIQEARCDRLRQSASNGAEPPTAERHMADRAYMGSDPQG